jgi:hypothetical protein
LNWASERRSSTATRPLQPSLQVTQTMHFQYTIPFIDFLREIYFTWKPNYSNYRNDKMIWMSETIEEIQTRYNVFGLGEN